MGRNGPAVLVCALSVLCGSAAARASVADYLGQPVASVRLMLDGRDTTEPALVQIVETRAGNPLSMLEVRESITHLFSLGRFDDVRVDASSEGAGVALRYELTPIHLVSKIDFAGSLGRPGVDVGQLRRAVVDRYGTSPPLGRVDDLSRAIVDTLRERGYRHPDVAPRADVDRQSGRTVLVFTVDAGPRTTIGAIDIVGTPTVPRDEFLSRLGLATGAPYEPEALAGRLASYVDTRRSRGYYEAKVTPAVAFADSERVANLTLTVAPGPHVSVVFTGDPLPEGSRAEMVPIEREGSADEDLLEDSSNRIEEALRAQGYRDAKAPHMRQEREGELLITFAVHRGPQYRVGSVEISGGASLPVADIRPALRTRSGEAYSDGKLDADVTAIESVYRGRGFASVKVQADPRPQAAAGATLIPVAVGILITEGVRTVVGTVRIEGNASIPETDLRQLLSLQPGVPYFDAQLRRDTDAIELAYANRGYRSATVDVQPGFTADRSQANLVFSVSEGPRIFVDHILIAGNVRTSAQTIERELQLKPGDPLSLAAEYESQRRLAALQLFRRAPQLTEMRHGDETRRDLLVTVEEAAPTTLGYGGGIEGALRAVNGPVTGGVATQKFELAPRAFIDLGRRNLFGKNRSLNVFASLSLHPQDLSGGSTVGYGFTEYLTRVTFREPRLLGTAFDGLLNASIEQQIRSSFNFSRRSVTAQASRRLTRHVSASGAYQLQHTHLLDNRADPSDQLLIDQVFTEVRLSSFLMQGAFDTRDDPVDSTRGEYVGANVQLAARRIGSEVGFAKSSFTAEVFRPLPYGHGSVFAAQARLGVATGFPHDVVETVDGQPVVVSDVKVLPEPERFFAGGDTTVRGFALDTLGAPDTIQNGFPIGGNAEAIFNGELRSPVRKGLQGVGFVDTGNVFAQAADIDLLALRTAVGFGFRYKSPVGPIRFDMGFKVKPETGERGSAWFISFGQAF
jgi:outer membrane protein insertion porin family